MKVSEPIGNPAWGAMMVRCALGSFLLIKGLRELDALPIQLDFFKHLSPHLRTILGIVIPYLEIAAGGLLFVGFWTTLASVLAAIIFFSFIYTVDGIPRSTALFSKDLILFAAAISLMYTGAGAFSVDKFRKS